MRPRGQVIFVEPLRIAADPSQRFRPAEEAEDYEDQHQVDADETEFVLIGLGRLQYQARVACARISRKNF